MSLEENKIVAKKISDELTSKMMGMFDEVLKSKKDFYINNPSKRPSKSEIKSIIRNTCITNATISGGMSLIPGPFGMVAVIPEIALVINNQLKMIYDLSIAYGKENKMNKELLLALFAGTSGMAGLGILAINGSKVLVKRSSLRIMQKIVALLGGKITQKVLKSVVAKWLPGVGAAAMAAWSSFQTNEIGKYASSILEKEIEISDEIIDNIEEVIDITDAPIINRDELTLNKFLALTNLIKIDGKVDDSEIKLLEEILDKEEINSDITGKILLNLNKKDSSSVNIEIIKKFPDDIIPFISDMVAMAKKDGEFHITEKLYIKQIAKDLAIDIEALDELFNL